MLKEFTLANFKSYRRATSLELSPLTLLIGANASGKSNVLEAFQLLSLLSRGRRLDDLFQAVREADLSIRGAVGDLVANGESTFSVGCKIEAGSAITLQLAIAADRNLGMRVARESVARDGESVDLYHADSASASNSHTLLVTYNNFDRGPNKPQILCTDQQAIFTQLLTPARFEMKHKKSQDEIPKTCEQLMAALGAILFLDPSPRRMREYSFIVDKTLKGDGSNISSILYDLCVTQASAEKVLAFVRDLPEQDIAGIEFLKGPRNEVMVQLVESFGGKTRHCDATGLSDGTLRVLAVAAALLSAPTGGAVVIEEIDNGVHPSRAKELLENIERTARERKLSVVITSHNPALIDAVPVAALPATVFCYRDPVGGDSRLVRLDRLADFPELIAQGPLGRLVTQGIVDRVVKRKRTDQQKIEAGLAWISKLEKNLQP